MVDDLVLHASGGVILKEGAEEKHDAAREGHPGRFDGRAVIVTGAILPADGGWSVQWGYHSPTGG